MREALGSTLTENFGAEAVQLTGSGTQALQLALQLASQSGGAPIALPAYSCYDVVTAAVGARVDVLFYDLDCRSLAPDLASFRAALQRGARTVVVGYLFGFPLNWDAIRAECGRFDALVIEDAAQGLGAEWSGIPAGGHGDLAVLSFGRGKGWTGGRGGALIVRSARLLPELQRFAGLISVPGWPEGLKVAGLLAGQCAAGRPSVYGWLAAMPGLRLGKTVYKEPQPVEQITAVAAATVLAHANHAMAEIGIRRQNARHWERLLAENPVFASRVAPCVPVDANVCGFLRYPLLLQTADAMDVGSLAALGVSRGYPRTLPELSALGATRIVGNFPGARRLAGSLVGLPTHSLMRSRDFAATANRLAEGAALARRDSPKDLVQ